MDAISHTHPSSDLVVEIRKALLSNEDAIDLAGSVADLALEELLKDEFLSKIPVATWIIQLKRTYTAISDQLFLAKMTAFLIQLAKSPAARESEFGRKLAKDDKASKRFSETIFFLLSKLDATQKAAVIAELCKSLLKGRIELLQFRRLCHIVDVMFVDDLLEHGRAHKSISNSLVTPEFNNLERYGLAKIIGTRSYQIRNMDESLSPEEGVNAKYTEDGQRLHEAIFEVLQGTVKRP